MLSRDVIPDGRDPTPVKGLPVATRSLVIRSMRCRAMTADHGATCAAAAAAPMAYADTPTRDFRAWTTRVARPGQ